MLLNHVLFVEGLLIDLFFLHYCPGFPNQTKHSAHRDTQTHHRYVHCRWLATCGVGEKFLWKTNQRKEFELVMQQGYTNTLVGFITCQTP